MAEQGGHQTRVQSRAEKGESTAADEVEQRLSDEPGRHTEEEVQEVSTGLSTSSSTTVRVSSGTANPINWIASDAAKTSRQGCARLQRQEVIDDRPPRMPTPAPPDHSRRRLKPSTRREARPRPSERLVDDPRRIDHRHRAPPCASYPLQDHEVVRSPTENDRTLEAVQPIGGQQVVLDLETVALGGLHQVVGAGAHGRSRDADGSPNATRRPNDGGSSPDRLQRSRPGHRRTTDTEPLRRRRRSARTARSNRSAGARSIEKLTPEVTGGARSHAGRGATDRAEGSSATRSPSRDRSARLADRRRSFGSDLRRIRQAPASPADSSAPSRRRRSAPGARTGQTENTAGRPRRPSNRPPRAADRRDRGRREPRRPRRHDGRSRAGSGSRLPPRARAAKRSRRREHHAVSGRTVGRASAIRGAGLRPTALRLQSHYRATGTRGDSRLRTDGTPSGVWMRSSPYPIPASPIIRLGVSIPNGAAVCQPRRRICSRRSRPKASAACRSSEPGNSAAASATSSRLPAAMAEIMVHVQSGIDRRSGGGQNLVPGVAIAQNRPGAQSRQTNPDGSVAPGDGTVPPVLETQIGPVLHRLGEEPAP